MNAPAPLIALYHRAVTFGGSFNSVVDVLSRVDRTRFAPVAAVPGPGNCSDEFRVDGTARGICLGVSRFANRGLCAVHGVVCVAPQAPRHQARVRV